MKTPSMVLLLALAGCAAPEPYAKPVGMPNPAAVYCVDQGGRLETRKTPQGETGYCHLPDGRVVEEWELFRSQHPRPSDTVKASRKR